MNRSFWEGKIVTHQFPLPAVYQEPDPIPKVPEPPKAPDPEEEEDMHRTRYWAPNEPCTCNHYLQPTIPHYESDHHPLCALFTLRYEKFWRKPNP